MPGMPSANSSSSSSSSCVSSISFDEAPAVTRSTADGDIKLVCSYGGKILPRRHDGKLRYLGGHTRVLTVQRSLRFHGLYQKLRELCGWGAMLMRCQLPTEDMDALVSVTGDDDLASVLDEYDVAAARQDPPRQQLRVRVFLHPPAGATTTRPPRSPITPPLAGGRHRRRPGSHHLLMHATRAAASPRAGRFILVTPLAPACPARPELFCQ